jgi:uncharacterized protein YcaQ
MKIPVSAMRARRFMMASSTTLMNHEATTTGQQHPSLMLSKHILVFS